MLHIIMIIFFILVILIRDSGVVLWGEITYWLLLEMS